MGVLYMQYMTERQRDIYRDIEIDIQRVKERERKKEKKKVQEIGKYIIKQVVYHYIIKSNIRKSYMIRNLFILNKALQLVAALQQQYCGSRNF